MTAEGSTAESAWNALSTSGGVFQGASPPSPACTGAYTRKASTCSSAPSPTVTLSSGGAWTFSFTGSVASATGGCTTANMCIAGYADTDVYTLASGSTVTYDFAAQGGSDWYEVGVVLMQGGSVITQKLFRGKSGSFSGTLATIGSTGSYFVRFFLGSYDRTGGTALGASLIVNGFSFS